jgi:hypothetical protein
LALAAFAAALAAGGADAATLVALTGSSTLVAIDTAGPRVIGVANMTGVAGRLLGIDVRPADGMLYGVLADGTVVTIDWRNGRATFKSRLTQTPPRGVMVSIDFNPAADRLRILGSDGTNLRANVDDGTVTADAALNFVQPNPFGGIAPKIVAGAYSNSRPGAKATLLWDIDSATNAFYLQLPPNAGTLNPVSDQLNIKVGQLGFDIQTDRNGVNTAWIVTGNRLFTVGLASGTARNGQRIQGLLAPVRDIAVLGQGR